MTRWRKQNKGERHKRTSTNTREKEKRQTAREPSRIDEGHEAVHSITSGIK